MKKHFFKRTEDIETVFYREIENKNNASKNEMPLSLVQKISRVVQGELQWLIKKHYKGR